MQFKRTALLALSAFALAACGSDDDGPTGNGGLNDAQKLQLFSKLTTAGSNAATRTGVGEVGLAFNFAAFGAIFGAQTADASVASNGLSLSITGAPTFATNGSGYEAVGVRFNYVYNLGGGETDTDQLNAVVLYRDTTDIVWGFSEGETGNFNTQLAFGGIYAAPNQAWTATTGTTSLTNANQGGDCPAPAALLESIEDALAQQGDGTLESFTCKLATFNGALNITGSQPNANAANARTASFTGNIPGIIITATYDVAAR